MRQGAAGRIQRRCRRGHELALDSSCTQQAQDQWLATKFKGTDVIGTNNEKIGDVNDMLFDQNGRVVAYIVGVGGFLGIGPKDVALAPTAFQMNHGSRGAQAQAGDDPRGPEERT